jgi:hypothetical protein
MDEPDFWDIKYDLLAYSKKKKKKKIDSAAASLCGADWRR